MDYKGDLLAFGGSQTAALPVSHERLTAKAQRSRRWSAAVVLCCLLYMIAAGKFFAYGLSYCFELYGKTTAAGQVAKTMSLAPEIGTVSGFNCDAAKGVECGTVVVPLNYFNRSEGTATIFFGRIKATKFPKQGSIMMNPGGPGGSGFTLINSLAEELPEMLGHDYDLIGFDPRGIGRTTPAVKCFPNYMDKILLETNTVLEQTFTVASNLSDPATREHLIAQEREWIALKNAEAEMCARNMGPELAYMGTANVVRDMDFMTKVFDGEDALINYWGGSYGTILGAYLVNMLPDRIRRAVIDGVANPVLWAEKPSQYWHADWVSYAEETYQLFLSECAKAGEEVCPLVKFGDSPAEIEKAIGDFLDRLYDEPLPVAGPGVRRPGFLSAGAVRGLILMHLYAPTTWPAAAARITAAMGGDGTALYNLLLPTYADVPPLSASKDMTRLAVTCLDSPPSEAPTAEELADIDLDAIRTVSRHFGTSAMVSEPDGGCWAWPVKGPERFEGPWNHTLQHPMLIISNTHDPITPLASGRLINKLMGKSSRLLIQNSPGHCSPAMPSLCTARTVHAYFANGTLPENEAHCDVDADLFPKKGETAVKTAGMNAEDAELTLKLARIGEALTTMRTGRYMH